MGSMVIFLLVWLTVAEGCVAQNYVTILLTSSFTDSGVGLTCDQPFLYTNFFEKIDVPVAWQDITESCYCLIQPSVNTSSLEQLELSVVSSPEYLPQTALNYQDWKDSVYGVPSFSVTPTQSSGPLFHIYRQGEQGFQRNGRTVISLVFGARGDSAYLNCSPHWYDGYSSTTTPPTTSVPTTSSNQIPMMAGVISAVSAVFLIITIIFICVCLKLRKKAHRNKLPPIPTNNGTAREPAARPLPADEDQFRQPEDDYDHIPDNHDPQYLELDLDSKVLHHGSSTNPATALHHDNRPMKPSPVDVHSVYVTPISTGESFKPYPREGAVRMQPPGSPPQPGTSEQPRYWNTRQSDVYLNPVNNITKNYNTRY